MNHAVTASRLASLADAGRAPDLAHALDAAAAGCLYAVDTGNDGYDEVVVADDEAAALAIVAEHVLSGGALTERDVSALAAARGWTCDRVVAIDEAL